MNRSPYLIIGNSVAAMGAVRGIREVDPEGGITIVAREPYHTYSRPLITYLLGGRVDESAMSYRPADFYEKNGVRPILGVEATGIDTEARVVHTADGDSLGFDRLLIATGGTPIIPQDVRGVRGEGVFTFTTWDDARNIKAFMKQNSVQEAVIVGGGLIGLKSVEALVALGVKATVVELADRILSLTFDRTASDLAQAALAKAGVDVRCGTTVAEIRRAGGRVVGVTLRDGSTVPCGMVIFAIGVAPNERIVEGTPIEVARGIVVDEHMQTSVEGIFAAGDVAEATDLISGEKRCIPILPTASRQGYIAGCNMAGRKRTYEGGMAMNAVDICGLPTISLGLTVPDGDGYEVLSTSDEEAGVYKKLVLKGDRIVGAIFIGSIERAGIITGLIRDRISVGGFKDMLLTDEFGLISLPTEYRKHLVSGEGIEV